MTSPFFVPGSIFGGQADSAVAFAGDSLLTADQTVGSGTGYGLTCAVIQISSGGIPSQIGAGFRDIGLPYTKTYADQPAEQFTLWRRVTWLGGSAFGLTYDYWDRIANTITSGFVPISWDGTTLAIAPRVDRYTGPIVADNPFGTQQACGLGDGTALILRGDTSGTTIEHIDSEGATLSSVDTPAVLSAVVGLESSKVIAYDNAARAFWVLSAATQAGPYDAGIGSTEWPSDGDYMLTDEFGHAVLFLENGLGDFGIPLYPDGTHGDLAVADIRPNFGAGANGIQWAAAPGGLYAVGQGIIV